MDSNEILKLAPGHYFTQLLLLDFWSIDIFKKVVQEKVLFKGYFWITHREISMDQKPKDKSCEQSYSPINEKLKNPVFSL